MNEAYKPVQCVEESWHPGFVRVSPYDSAERRALWMKLNAKTNTLEIRAGREGDDEYVKLSVGDVITQEMFGGLVGSLERARGDCGGDNGWAPWEGCPTGECGDECVPERHGWSLWKSDTNDD
jgi:hypothetical protein